MKLDLNICRVSAVVVGMMMGPLAMEASANGPELDPAARAKIDALLAEIPTMDIANMPALGVKRFTLPEAGVDVLRANVEETYTIEGVGKETVQLTGWIAVVHGSPVSIVEGQAPRWGNAQVGTEFVGLDLRGKSELFGPIRVTLNKAVPSIGRVGVWKNGDPTDFLLKVGMTEDEADDINRPGPQCAPTDEQGSAGQECCYAPLGVTVEMPDLQMTMTTGKPVVMYSSVDTIPPVGVTASVSLAARPLIVDTREVGTLQSAAVKFREIVYHLPLDGKLLDKRFNIEVSSK